MVCDPSVLPELPEFPFPLPNAGDGLTDQERLNRIVRQRANDANEYDARRAAARQRAVDQNRLANPLDVAGDAPETQRVLEFD
jgi:hypothetical protein